MATSAVFPTVPMRAGSYESFYLRAVSPDEPLGVWIRHTVHKPPGKSPSGSVWCTVFDGRAPAPFQHKITTQQLRVPHDGWIEIGEPSAGARAAAGGATGEAAGGASGEGAGEVAAEGSGSLAVPAEGASEGAVMSSGEARGICGPARWRLSFSSREGELRHLPRPWLYRAPLPRTKLTSPLPSALFEGTLELAGRAAIELRAWPGMIGHNWGSEHAERWIWLHGLGFAEAHDAWLDVALGRVKVAGRMTPWIANGALAVGGRRFRLGGLATRGLQVAESAARCELELPGERGLRVTARVEVPPGTAAGWRYSDPSGGSEHDVVNCSIASLALSVTLPGESAARALRTQHGGAYELGMREHDHGIEIAPFHDG